MEYILAIGLIIMYLSVKLGNKYKSQWGIIWLFIGAGVTLWGLTGTIMNLLEKL